MQRSYYFTEEMLTSLFLREGFTCEEMKIHSRSVENRVRELVMHRQEHSAADIAPIAFRTMSIFALRT